MDLVFGLGGVLLVAHLYAYGRLVACTGSDRRWRFGGAVALAMLYLVTFTSLATQRWGPWHGLTPVHAVGMTWLGVMIYVVLLLFLGEAVRLVLTMARRVRRTEAVRREGHRTTARIAAVVSCSVAVAVVGYGLTQALGPVRTINATIVLPDLPDRFEGYRIAVVTDLHLGPLIGEARTRHVVESVNAADVDLVAVVGDLSDGLPRDLEDATAPLAALDPSDGVFFTTGNHEYFFDARAWQESLPDLRMTFLDNESRPVVRGDSRLLIAGVTDYIGDEFGDGADLGRALADRRTDDIVVLLAHQPRQVDTARAADVDLQLSGHTHGGQFWPIHLPTQLQQGTLAGLSRHGRTQVWTSRGAGFWGPPIRVGAPPDTGILTLTRG